MKNLVTLGKLLDGKLFQMDVRKFIQTRLSVMASSGGGKTYALLKILQATRGLMPQVVFDPEGDFTPLRRKAEYNYVLAAPKGGDVVAHPSTAAVLARHFMERNFSLLIDMYEMDLPDQRRFVRLFCEGMLAAPRKLWRPRLVMVDECQEFAPEKGGDSAESLAALVRVAKKGRKRGLALVPATQRPADIAKALTSQLGNKLIGVAFSDIDQDRAAKELRIRNQATADTIGLLEPGHFYAMGPAIGRDLKQVHMDMPADRPDEGGKASLRRPPSPGPRLKGILASLTELPKEALEEAKTLEELRSKVRGLEIELRRKVVQPVPPHLLPDPQKVKDLVKNLEAKYRKSFDEGIAQVKEQLKAERIGWAQAVKKGITMIIQEQADITILKVREAMDRLMKGAGSHVVDTAYKPPMAPMSRPVTLHPTPMMRKPPVAMPINHAKQVEGDVPNVFNEAQKKILAFLLTQQDGKVFTFVQVGAMVQMSGNGGHFGNQITALAKAGIVVRENGTMALKDRALAMQVVGDMEILTGRKAMEAWLQKFGELPRKIYQALLDNPDTEFTLPELAEHVGGKMGGHFGNCVGEVSTVGLALRKNGKVRLNPEIKDL